VNCAVENLCNISILNTFKIHISFGERIISFERAKTPLRIQQSNDKVTNYIAIIYIDLQVAFLPLSADDLSQFNIDNYHSL